MVKKRWSFFKNSVDKNSCGKKMQYYSFNKNNFFNESIRANLEWGYSVLLMGVVWDFFLLFSLLINILSYLGIVVLTCNRIYLGGWGRRMRSSRPTWATQQDPFKIKSVRNTAPWQSTCLVCAKPLGLLTSTAKTRLRLNLSTNLSYIL